MSVVVVLAGAYSSGRLAGMIQESIRWSRLGDEGTDVDSGLEAEDLVEAVHARRLEDGQ